MKSKRIFFSSLEGGTGIKLDKLLANVNENDFYFFYEVTGSLVRKLELALRRMSDLHYISVYYQDDFHCILLFPETENVSTYTIARVISTGQLSFCEPDRENRHAVCFHLDSGLDLVFFHDSHNRHASARPLMFKNIASMSYQSKALLIGNLIENDGGNCFQSSISKEWKHIPTGYFTYPRSSPQVYADGVFAKGLDAVCHPLPENLPTSNEVSHLPVIVEYSHE